MKAEFYESVGASGLPQAVLEVGRPALGKGRVEKDGARVRAFVDHGEPRPWQRLGRLLGEEGIFSFALDAPKGMAFGKDQALCLLQGMRVAKAPKETCRIALPLGEGELSAVAQEWAILDWARDLANRGASACRPQDLARAVASALGAIAEGYGLAARSEIIMGDDLRLKGLTGLCAVGGGSAHGPCMLVMEVAAGQDLLGTPPEVALVGKGITFDSGGYDLKTAAFMDTMRTDKCGAVYLAAVAMLLASRQGCPHLLLCLPCAENLAGPMAMLPGDILNYPNGLAVEVGNTDAEGRLVLADALLLDDVETMNAIRKAVDEIDPTIFI
ncbi:MAG: hypothetical protein K6A65_05570, partial [Succinivibrionaceae bacterium]|nr:hypothetical protein [Succinivibrionaceae bacterium]